MKHYKLKIDKSDSVLKKLVAKEKVFYKKVFLLFKKNKTKVLNTYDVYVYFSKKRHERTIRKSFAKLISLNLIAKTDKTKGAFNKVINSYKFKK